MTEIQPTYLFFCGVGRSGTTVLRTSLGAHPQIYYNGFENNIVQDLAGVALRNCTMQSRKNAMVVSQSQYDAHFRELTCSLIWPDETLRQRPVHMAAINPTPVQLDYLVQLFPRSKFVGLVRNGIEVVSSRTEFESFAANEFSSHCEVWNRTAAVFDWGRNHSDRFLEVRQEWFYEPETLSNWMLSFCKWLGVGYSDAPENRLGSSLQHPTSASDSIGHGEFSQKSVDEKRDYFLSKRDRWKSWTQEQRGLFEARCGNNMTALGYEIPWS